MSPRVKKILRGLGYASFYLFCLVLFAYLTFPYDRLKNRITAEFNARQLGGAGTRLELEDLDGYWLSGIEAEGVRLVPLAATTAEPSAAPANAEAEGEAAAEKSKILTIDEAHARVSILRWVFGTTHVSFGADAFGGEVSGYTSDSGDVQKLYVETETVNVAGVPLLEGLVGLPIGGQLDGIIDLTLPEGKLAQAEGQIGLTIASVTVGDGKAKIRDTIALPKLDAGQLVLELEATEGRLEVKKLTAEGPDLELVADGRIRLRDPFESSLVEMSLRFKFTDRYTSKNDMTRGLFGTPGSNVPGVFDLDPKNRRAKRPDGFYSWRVTGPISHLTFEPAPMAGGVPGAGSRPMRGFSPRRAAPSPRRAE
jgi:type II secretion system protein N